MSVDSILGSGIVVQAVEVTATLGGRVLGSVPIAQGQVVESAAGESLARLAITVEATDEWVPSHPAHPLAAFGQELIVRRGFLNAAGERIGWEHLGTFRIMPSSAPSGGWLDVEAESVDVRLRLARWVVPTRTSGTLRSQLEQICFGVVPVVVSTIPDRAIPDRTWEAQDTRRESLIELCDAAGAVPRIIAGRLTILPAPTATAATSTVRSGRGGTLVSADPVTDGDVTPNAVVASSAPENSTAPITRQVSVMLGPRRYAGPYGPVPTFFASPLLTTYAQCTLAARTRLDRLQASSPDLEVRCVTDPRIRLGSVVRVVDEPTDTDAVVRVTQATHALTPGREPGGFRGLVLSGRIGGAKW